MNKIANFVKNLFQKNITEIPKETLKSIDFHLNRINKPISQGTANQCMELGLISGDVIKSKDYKFVILEVSQDYVMFGTFDENGIGPYGIWPGNDHRIFSRDGSKELPLLQARDWYLIERLLK